MSDTFTDATGVDPEGFISNGAVQKLMTQSQQDSEAANTFMRGVIPEVDAISAQASAQTSGYQNTMKTINDGLQDSYNKVIRTKSLPVVGDLLGLVDPDYNVRIQNTKIKAAATAGASATQAYQAGQDALKTQADLLKTKITTQDAIARNSAQALHTQMEGLSGSLAIEKRNEDFQIRELMSQPDDVLKKALAGGQGLDTVKVGGKEFKPGVVTKALTSRQTLSNTINHGILENVQLGQNIDENSRKKTEAQMDKLATDLPFDYWNSLKGSEDANGNVLLTDPYNPKQQIAVNLAGMVNKSMKFSETMKGALDYQSTLAADAKTRFTEVGAALSKADALLTVDPAAQFDPAGNLQTASQANMALQGTKQAMTPFITRYGEIQQTLAAGKPLTVAQMQFLTDPVTTGALKQLVGRTNAGVDEATKALTAGMNDVSKNAFTQRVNNNGLLTDQLLAKDVLGHEIAASPVPFVALPELNSLATGVMKDQEKILVTDFGNMTKEQQNQLFSVMMRGSLVKPGSDTNYLTGDVVARQQGLNGMQGAYFAALSDRALKDGVNRYVMSVNGALAKPGELGGDELKQASSGTIFSEIIDANGNWTPDFVAIRNKVGTAAALAVYANAKESGDIANGKMSVNDNSFNKFGSWFTNEMTEGRIKLPKMVSNADAAMSKNMANNDNRRVVLSVLGSVLNQQPTNLLKQVQQYSQNIDSQNSDIGLINANAQVGGIGGGFLGGSGGFGAPQLQFNPNPSATSLLQKLK